jgi:alkylation response protein AidB-like acyl-CoA dehydrogenase
VGHGSLYLDLAAEMRGLDAAGKDVGATNIARGAEALAELVQRAKRARLGRQQHVIFQLADAIAALETAAALTRKAASWQRHPDAEAAAPGWAGRLATLARLQSAVAAEEVGRIAYRILASTAALDAEAVAAEKGPLHPGTLLAAWDGRMTDLDRLAAWLPEHDLLADPALPEA